MFPKIALHKEEGKENVGKKPYELWNQQGIICGKFQPNTHWDVEIARQIVNDRLKLSEDGIFPLLLDVSNVSSISKEARKFMASEQAMEQLSAGALIINSKVGVIMGNFYIFLDRPKLPCRLFYDFDDAEKWLQDFIYSN